MTGEKLKRYSGVILTNTAGSGLRQRIGHGEEKDPAECGIN